MSHSKLPEAPGSKHADCLIRWYGYSRDRVRGSPAVLTKAGSPTLSMPLHRPSVKKATLHALLKSAGIEDDDYAAAFFGRREKTG